MTLQEQLVALLGPLAPGGISPSVAIQNVTFPYLVYRRMPTHVENVLDPGGNPPADNTIFEISCWARTYPDAVNLAAAVTQAMLGWSVPNIKRMGDHDLEEADVKCFRVVQEYSIWVPA
ncbi:DUF3168 domain-containing protein [Paraburkholderia panacisoli]|uniref:DUF3168 domain-containing protein n=1 Tax=Paraburkholderia panacisoli TaxID=2603818 RepID=A0A5B0HMF6_9BURK|nr:DUF3168 domain-containing protein [Paraburkholderia panacisoli]KAA1015973.1 DUF3168 domain-containing protein [Paraburkholderia panacisoli]